MYVHAIKCVEGKQIKEDEDLYGTKELEDEEIKTG